MAINDPVEQDYVDINEPAKRENLAGQMTATKSEERANLLSFQAAAIDEAREGTPLLDAFQQIRGFGDDPKAELERRAAEVAQDDMAGYVDSFISDPGMTEEEAVANWNAVQDLIRELEESGRDEDLAFIRAISESEEIDLELEQQLAFQLRAAKMMQQIWDDMSWGEVVYRGLGLLVPGQILKTNKRMTDSYFNAQEYMQNFVRNFKALPVEEQTELLPHVKEWLFEGLGNEFRVMGVLSAILAPGGEEDLHEFNKWWAAFDVADMALITGTLAQKVSRLASQLNAVRVLANANAKVKAADMAAASVVDKGVRKAANLQADEVADIALGFDTGLSAAYAGGLSQPVTQRLMAFEKQARQLSDSISGEQFVLRESFTQRQERISREGRYIDELTEAGAENIRITGRDRDTTTFQFEEVVPVFARDGERATVTTEKTLQLTLDDVGSYVQSNIGVLESFFGSPTVWARGNLAEDVSTAIRQDTEQAKIYKHLTELHRISVRDILGPGGMKGLNPASRRKLAQLDNVLRVGDEQQRVFTPTELRAGVNGVPLNDTQIEAYYKIRSLVDSLFYLRNAEERRARAARGMKEVRLEGDIPAIARPYEQAQSAEAVVRQHRPDIIWNIPKNRFEQVQGLSIHEMYDRGFRLVRFENATEIPGTGERVNFAFVWPETINPLPEIVLHYRPGYVPKVNLNAHYFVKESHRTRVDGREVDAWTAGANVQTIRIFDTKKDAQKWADSQMAAQPERNLRVLEDRQLELERRAGLVDGPSSGGFGLYTGARAGDDIPFGIDGRPMERLGSFESISRNVASLSRYITRNEWRLGMEQRILNTANSLIPGGNYKSYQALEAVPDTQAGRFIRKMTNTLDEWMGMPSKEERLWEAMMAGVYENVAGLPGARSIAWARSKDPFTAARAASFNLLLGWFTPAQVVVQGSGAMVAMSMNMFRPMELARVLKQQTVLAAADMTTSPAHLAHIARSANMDVSDLTHMVEAWRKTGLREGILTTADHAAIVSGRGVTMDMVSRGAEAGRFFYNIGELFNRRTSFVTAYREWARTNPGRAPTADELRDILTRTNNFMLNLHKANRANWQKGALGIPTQFLQIATKFGETALGLNKRLTPMERAKMVFAQTLLYGAAGIPLGGWFLNAWLGQMGVDQAEIEALPQGDERVKLLNEGAVGISTMMLFGIDVDIAPRLSLVRSLTDYTDKFLFDDGTLAGMFLGAFGSVADRFWSGFMKTWDTTSLGLAEQRVFDPLQAVSDIAKAASSWNNASKALFMHRFNMIPDSTGRPIVQKDFSIPEVVAQAIGFQHSDVIRVYSLDQMSSAKEQLRSDITNTIVEVMWDYAHKMHNDELNDAERERTERKLALLMQTLENPREQQLVREEVQRRLREGGDRYAREWRRYRNNWSDGSVGELLNLRQVLTSRGILRQGGFEEFEEDFRKEMEE